jgi:hypothetical protein
MPQGLTLTLAYYVLKAAGFGGLFVCGSADAYFYSWRENTIRMTPTTAVASPIQIQRD